MDERRAPGLGFVRVLELENGQPARLPEDIQVENYQCGRIDSAFWLRYHDDTILNLNDCPTSESWVTAWLRAHPHPDVALSAFSYASPFPVCYELAGEERGRVVAQSRARVLGQFSSTMGALRPRYAVPFATQFAFLLPEQRWMNDSIPTPLMALATLSDRHADVEGVLLDPGDSLSIRGGKLASGRRFDWLHRDREIEAAASARRLEIESVVTSESASPDDCFERFTAYFERLVSRNWLLRRKVGLRIAFVPEPGEEQWQVDCTRSRHVVSRGIDLRSCFGFCASGSSGSPIASPTASRIRPQR